MPPEFALLAAALAAAVVLWLRERRLRRRVARELREMEARRAAYRNTAEHLSEGVILLDSRDRVVFANAAASGLLDVPPPPSSDPPPALGAWANPSFAASLRYGNPEETQRRVVELEGKGGPRTVELTSGPAEGGKRFLLLRDLRGAVAVDLKRRDFVANASHELQTPIAALIGLLDLLEDSDPATAAPLLQRAQRNAQSLSALTRDLLGLAKAEDPGWRPAPRGLKVAEAVARVEERLREKAAAKGLALVVRVTPPELEIVADRGSLDTVLANLVDNAISYTERGRVELRVSSEGVVGVTIEVEDTGPGIDPEILPRIFERFFRGDPAHSRASGGTGLGLAIVRNLVGRMGGRIAVRSRPGEGALFRVELPFSPAKPLPGAGQASFS
ncbi:MAG: hypothetical protein ISR76_05990 [Planctomycetes bacterium]|nr:hypothetical protein [Planctomycetota bacterium]